MKNSIFEGRSLRGVSNAYGSAFIVETFESKEHPGFYHASVVCLDDSFIDETKKPIRIDGFEPMLENLLKPHNLKISEFEWKEVSKEELFLHHHQLSKKNNPE